MVVTSDWYAVGRQGPISKAELKQAVARGQMSLQTPFWAAGMAQPQPLGSLRELRWLVSHGSGWTFTIAAFACHMCLIIKSCSMSHGVEESFTWASLSCVADMARSGPLSL